MSLKLREFARSNGDSLGREEEGSGRRNSDRRISENSDEISYSPERRSSSRTRSRSPPRSYSAVPTFRDEKPFFGPPGADGNISVKYPSVIDGYDVDGKELAAMDQLGLPTGFSINMGRRQEKAKKGEKRTYYCDICLITLNSEDTMQSHVKGVKHMKKQLQIQQEREKNFERGLITKKELMSFPVKQIPNPESTKVKVPVRLHAKIKETSEPVVGLDFVKEVIAVSDAEMEPHYTCSLCGSQGIANGMFSHIMGFKHRQRFVEETFKDKPEKTVNLSQHDLLRYARRFAENDETSKIDSRNSDEAYPWPPGKAPWAVERGGTGIAPDGAIDKFGQNQHHTREAKPVIIRERRRGGSGEGNPGMGLPSPRTLRKPRSQAEADNMVQLAGQMLEFGIQYSAGRLRAEEVRLLRTTVEAVLTKLGGAVATPPAPHSPAPPPTQRPGPSHASGHAPLRNSRSPSPPPVKRERRSPSGDRHRHGNGWSHRDGRGHQNGSDWSWQRDRHRRN